ncbi:hypothetical protein A2U01_0108936, partial [Trifolium medium]|nr:hypothetical protein [Trifolium medium]
LHFLVSCPSLHLQQLHCYQHQVVSPPPGKMAFPQAMAMPFVHQMPPW